MSPGGQFLVSLDSLEVPPAFVAWNAMSGLSAALIEWFYVDGQESFVMAGDFLQKIRPDFDRDKGTRHNMKDNALLLRTLSVSRLLHTEWRQWWVDALVFDALIGNTDRHQDNWGLIFQPGGCRLSPLFDNGTSLGHERFTDRAGTWTELELDRYIAKGRHHVRWGLDETQQERGHLALLARALAEWPETRGPASARLGFSPERLVDCISDLLELDVPVRLSLDRHTFMLRLLKRRHELLVSLLK